MSFTTVLPSEPTPNIVLVKNIASTTQEKTIRDFFLFCGKIKEFEIIKDDEHQKALVWFERPSAAKTAILLSNASVDNVNILVEPYFESTDPNKTDEKENIKDTDQEAKPVSNVMAEILAAGYSLGDNILAKGLEFDTKIGFTSRVQQYFNQLQANLQQLNQKYHVSDRAMDVEHKIGIQDKAMSAVGAAQATASELLHTPTGQKVQGFATQVADQIASLHAEAKRLAVSVT
ncbi:hypothetical protein J3Q64DRAFT_1765674 [Phycomyces blakesleeanus]|uniref:RRM domain-containing protein n=2 Tax=Phycomyces blakesleeanus TaxID=4837 RepID=A0ABR3AP00_PHYBL